MTLYPLSVAVMHIAWYSEDKPFAVGYADGKLLIGSKEPLEKGAIVVIDAHKVKLFCKYKESIFLKRSVDYSQIVLLTESACFCFFTGVNHQYEVESYRPDLADVCQRGDGEAVGESRLRLRLVLPAEP